MATLSEFLAVHDNVRRNGNGYLMRCKGHEDRQSSLSAKEADGKILVHCFAGCPAEQIVGAVGWELKDLFLESKMADDGARVVRGRKPATVTRWEIRDGNGELKAIHERVDPGKKIKWYRPDGSSGLNGMSSKSLPLYGSEQAAKWDLGAPVVVTEGEKAADALLAAGHQAVGTLGVDVQPNNDALAVLSGHIVTLWPDADEVGREHMLKIAGDLRDVAAEVRMVQWLDAPAKGDAADASPEQIRELVSAATVYDAPGAEIGSLAAALDATLVHIERFVRFSDPAQAIAFTLWIAHTHAYERGETSPILWIRSAVPQSGKTRAFEVTEHLVPRPWIQIRPSEAVLYHHTDKVHPTVLLDEIDAVFKDKSNQFEGLRAYLNAGNRRGVKVPRWNQAANKMDEFSIFTPKAIAGLGSVPDTVASRAIPIVLRRRAKHEIIERLRVAKARALGEPLRLALSTYVRQIGDLTVDEHLLPEQLSDRQWDSWEPLLAIADAAGGAWPDQARKAAVALHVGTEGESEENYSLRLLGDTRVVFNESGEEWIKTADLITKLMKFEESPWADIRGKEISPHYLAKLLKEFGIRPKHSRLGKGTERGYAAEQFTDAWSRYLPDYPSATGTSGTSGTVSTHGVPDVPVVPLTQGYQDKPAELLSSGIVDTLAPPEQEAVFQEVLRLTGGVEVVL